jgi:hypothetical protein
MDMTGRTLVKHRFYLLDFRDPQSSPQLVSGEDGAGISGVPWSSFDGSKSDVTLTAVAKYGRLTT